MPWPPSSSLLVAAASKKEGTSKCWRLPPLPFLHPAQATERRLCRGSSTSSSSSFFFLLSSTFKSWKKEKRSAIKGVFARELAPREDKKALIGSLLRVDTRRGRTFERLQTNPLPKPRIQIRGDHLPAQGEDLIFLLVLKGFNSYLIMKGLETTFMRWTSNSCMPIPLPSEKFLKYQRHGRVPNSGIRA